MPTLLVRSAIPGFVVALFFQCMYALLNPVHCTSGRIKWGLVVHTAAMFSFATINAGMCLDIQSFSYVEKRSYSGYEGLYRSGPLGYLALIYSKPISVVPPLMFFLGNWLADGLLVSSGSSSVAQSPNADYSASSIVVICFIP